jgi:hypothetical protein
VISLEILARIEAILRRQSGRDDLVLSDYFDYIGGTSTGAIIATCLSIGMCVNDIRDFYHASGPAMFSRAGILKRFWYKFDEDNLSAKLRSVLQVEGRDMTLGDAAIRTLLLLVLRNATTDSPWPVSNNPLAKYNDRSRPDCNLELPLWQLVRASTAAPTYFPPEVVTIGRHEFLFVDGGVTTYNNPAFQLFLMATVEPYRVCWPTGVDRMLLVSVGTGTSPCADANLHPADMNLAYQAMSIPNALMFAALNEQDFLCRSFGKTVAGGPIDREIGNMHHAAGPVREKLFTYARYNVELTPEGLAQVGLTNIRPEHVRAMDSVDHVPEMVTVGKHAAEREVRDEHFAGFPAELEWTA